MEITVWGFIFYSYLFFLFGIFLSSFLFIKIKNILFHEMEEWYKTIRPNTGEGGAGMAEDAGYVQGVCECVAAISNGHALEKKLLSDMNITKDMAKKFANPETYKTLEQGIFARKPE